MLVIKKKKKKAIHTLETALLFLILNFFPLLNN